MIKISSSPFSIVEMYQGTIELDKKYDFIVEKTIQEKQSFDFDAYKVTSVTVSENHNEDIDPIIVRTIIDTVKNWGRKNGIGKSRMIYQHLHGLI